VPRPAPRLPWPVERPSPTFARPEGAPKAAAWASTVPAPTASGSWEAAPLAVAVRANFARSGLREGLACSIGATAPETTPAAIEVPLPCR
jgi:hypothetical protein